MTAASTSTPTPDAQSPAVSGTEFLTFFEPGKDPTPEERYRWMVFRLVGGLAGAGGEVLESAVRQALPELERLDAYIMEAPSEKDVEVSFMLRGIAERLTCALELHAEVSR